MIISIVAIVLALVAIGFTGHLAIVYQRFNDGIKDWAESIDSTTNAAIQRAARQILKELDEKISEANLMEQTDFENVEPINEENNE